jgi:FkbM family methyltransferase
MFKKAYKDLKRGYKRGRDLKGFPPGTKAPISYRLRHLLIPHTYLPAYVNSPRGASHFLSSDPLDDRVLEEILGGLEDLFFPAIPKDVEQELNNGGVILDVGAFNGGWGIEMLVRFPTTVGIFMEPSPEKCKNMKCSFEKSKINSRVLLVTAGLAKQTGEAWLVKSDDGSWGDWLEYTKPEIGRESISVPTVTLADALKGKKPIIVKSNSEGGEFELVKQLIDQKIHPRIMILMVHPEMGDVDYLRSSLEQNNFTINVVKNHERRPVWHVTHSG